MGELDDNFALLLGRQPSDNEQQALYRVRDALKLKATDSVWLLLMVLEYYVTLYERFPARIGEAAREVTKTVRAAQAEAQAAAGGDEEGARASGPSSGGEVGDARRRTHLVKWVSIAAGSATLSIGFSAYGSSGGESAPGGGREVGDGSARRRRGVVLGEHARGPARLQPRPSRQHPRPRDLHRARVGREGRKLLRSIRTWTGAWLAPPRQGRSAVAHDARRDLARPDSRSPAGRAALADSRRLIGSQRHRLRRRRSDDDRCSRPVLRLQEHGRYPQGAP